eukprot:evm.model.scf_1201.4 EVM.evm.TU.scf_1201.4   scf_1201:38182-40780(+)
MFKPEVEGGNGTATCNGAPFEGDSCRGVFQYKAECNKSLPHGNVSVTKTTDCFGKITVNVGAFGSLADGTVDVACTGVLRFSEKTINTSASATSGSLMQYRCAYDFTYTSTEGAEDAKKRGETFQDCKYLAHVLEITSSAGPKDAGLVASGLEETADALMDEAFTANTPPDSALPAEEGAARPLFAHPASLSDSKCKTDVTCNGEATTYADSCVGDWSAVEDCTGEEGGVTKTLCKGSWYPTPKSATCKGDFSSEFDISADAWSFGSLTGCKGTQTASWDVKGGMSFFTALCMGKNMHSTNYDTSADTGADPRRAVGVVTVT